MKKRILCLVGGIVFLIGACTPIEDRQEAGPVVPASDFNYSITNDASNDYILYLDNKTPGVMFSWDYAWGVSRKQHDTVRMLVPGTYTVNITATTAGGLVTDKKTVTVTKSDPSAFQAPEWTYLTNKTVGKTWIWDDSQAAPWGNGGFKGCNAPCWWAVSKSDLNGRGVGSDEMTFDLNGGRHLALNAASVPSKGVIAGTFDLQMGVILKPGWDIGKLTTTNTTVINGIFVNNSNARVETFYVLKLTNTSLVLSAPEPGVTGDWGTAWFWMFKPKSK
jgi:PKD repeat protein